MMQAKLLKAEGLDQLEKNVNEFLSTINDKYADSPHLTELQNVKIHNVQQFTIGEINDGLLSQQQKVKYLFCLLIFYTVEPLQREK